jgi:hypothetical protein
MLILIVDGIWWGTFQRARIKAADMGVQPPQPPPRELLETFLQHHMPHNDIIAHESHTEVKTKGPGVCDFCSSKLAGHPDETTFFVDDVWVDTGLEGMPPYLSKGAWAACEMCATLIRANTPESRDALFHYTVRAHKKLYPSFDHSHFDATLGAAQRAFWSVYQKQKKEPHAN